MRNGSVRARYARCAHPGARRPDLTNCGLGGDDVGMKNIEHFGPNDAYLAEVSVERGDEIVGFRFAVE